MRFVRLRTTGRTGLLLGDGAQPVPTDLLSLLDGARPHFGSVVWNLLQALLREDSWESLIGAWSSISEPLFGFVANVEDGMRLGDGALATRVASDSIGPPLPSRHTRIFAVGANFADHARNTLSKMPSGKISVQSLESERDRGLPPWGYLVIPDVVIGDRDLVAPPKGVNNLDYEAEVAAVLGCGGRYLSTSEITFWGVTAMNDFSIRDGLGDGSDVDRGPMVWALGKNFESGKSLGPCVSLCPDVDPCNVSFSLMVNGELRQQDSTASMVYGFAEVAAFLSQYVQLRPGDIVSSGTPGGTAFDSDLPYLRPKDEIVIGVDGVGELRNTVGSW